MLSGGLAAGAGAGKHIFNAAARVGRMGRTAAGAGGVTTRGGKFLNQEAQAMSGYRRMGAAGGGLYAVNRMRSPRSSGADGLQPHSMGGTTMMDQQGMY